MRRVPGRVWKWLYSVLDEVSDEVGSEQHGSWLLAYEGWGGFGVGHVWENSRSRDENEDACLACAAEMAGDVIAELAKRYRRTHELVESGHEPSGLYGVTWALFRLRRRRDRRGGSGGEREGGSGVGWRSRVVR